MKKQTKATPAFDFSCCALIIAEYTDCMKMKKKKPILICVDTTYIKIATYNDIILLVQDWPKHVQIQGGLSLSSVSSEMK